VQIKSQFFSSISQLSQCSLNTWVQISNEIRTLSLATLHEKASRGVVPVVAHYRNIGWDSIPSTMPFWKRCYVGQDGNCVWLHRRPGTGRVNFPLEMFT